MARRFAWVGALCALVLVVGGCGGGGDDGPTMVSVFNSEPQKPLVPGNTNETGGVKVIDLLFSRLVSFDVKGVAHNEVAESIEANGNATQYTVRLKDGWTFTDGTPVTAGSFTKAWSYTANVRNAQLSSSFFSMIAGYADLQKDGLDGTEQLSGLKVVDERTFTVDLAEPDSLFAIKVGYVAFSPLPESFYKDPKAFGESPVGNGPYRFSKWDHDARIDLVRNPDYHGNAQVRNEGVSFRIYTDTEAAYRDVQAGNLDVMESVPASSTKTFEKDSKVQAYNKVGSAFESFAIPSGLERFDNTTQEGRLRRAALSRSIDRTTICDKVFNGVCTPALDFSAPPIPGYSDALAGREVLTFDEAEARKLWDEANAIAPWPADAEVTFSYNADGGFKPVYDAIANSVRNALGIETESVAVPTFQAFRDAISNRQVRGAFRAGWKPTYPSVQNYLAPLYASSAADGKGSNDGDYRNPEFDVLLAQAAAALDPAQSDALYQKAEEVLLRDLPSIPLYYSNATGVAALGVTGFAMNWQNLPDYAALSK